MTRTQAIHQARGPLAFTQENAQKSLDGRKWQTRRAIAGLEPGEHPEEAGGIYPPWKPGDLAYVPEPVRIESYTPGRCGGLATIDYLWESFAVPNTAEVWISVDDQGRIEGRKRGIHAATNARFMLKAFARYFVRIKSVRVERLCDITRGDCMAEGCPFPNLNGKEVGHTDPRGWFAKTWDSIHGAGAWERNPYVWVIDYEAMGVTA